MKGNLRPQDSVMRNHVQIHFQLTVSGANGATGVLAPKLVELDLKKGIVKYHNMLRMEDNSVVDNLMKQSSVQMNHVQLIANGANGVTGVAVLNLVMAERRPGLGESLSRRGGPGWHVLAETE